MMALAVYVMLLTTIVFFLRIDRIRREFFSAVVNILSRVIDIYLSSKHPIYRNDGSSKTSLPTCPYRFPNGQGDVAKFLEGESNSTGWGAKYGGVYRIWSGTTPEIVLTKTDDVKTMFRTSNTHIKAGNNNGGWLMGQLLGSCLGLVSGEEWQRTLTSTGASFIKAEIVGRISQIEKLTKVHLETLYRGGRLRQGILHPVNDLRMLPFWIVTNHLYGNLKPELALDLEALIPLREALFGRVIQGGVTRFSWSQYLPTKTNRDLRHFKENWRAFNNAACESAEPNAPIVDMYRAVQDGCMSSENFYQTVDEMLFANLDVTMGAISWNLMFLAANPDIQDRIRDEISQARAGGKDEKWKDYLSSSTTLLACSILESARLKPLAAFTVPQAAQTSHNVSGFRIPPRTNIVIDTYAVNIRNEFWGNDSDSYRPERFLGRTMHEMRYHYWRFGFGPRQCLGKHLAEMMVKVLLAQLLTKYKLSLRPDSSWSKNPETWITHPNTDLSCEEL